MIVSVTKAVYVENFIIELSLTIVDGKLSENLDKKVDLKDYINSKKTTGVFAPLRDIDYFKDFTLNANTIEWANGADIAPERFLEL